MKKGWRVILAVVLVALILGGACIAVGILTGADTARVTQNLEEHMHVTTYAQMVITQAQEVWTHITGIFGR